MSLKILILCTGNSCRSQMAHGFLQSFDKRLQVCSAGTKASGTLNINAVKSMAQVGIDISNHKSESIEKYLREPWDYIITVCGGAKDNCPVFMGEVKKMLHMGFEDPSEVVADEATVLFEFERIRNAIKETFYEWYLNDLLPIIATYSLCYFSKC